jgi:hypothetical protein
MSEQLAIAGPKASDQLATFLGIEKGMMLDTLKAQCFKGKRPEEVSDTQLAAFVSTANVLQVNPLIPGMLYAYPERNGGITPILGPDGVFKRLDEFVASGKLAGFECEVHMGVDGKPDRAEAIIHRVGDQKPAKYTAYYSEWAVTSNPNWQARPRHMLWVRAIKQAARQVIHGLPMDADEYEIAQMHNVTPPEVAPERPAPPKRSPKGAAAVKQNVEVVVPAEEPKTVTPEPVAEPAPVAESKPEAPAPVQSFADAAKATEGDNGTGAAVIANPPSPRAFLNDGEQIEAVCKIKAVTTFAARVGGQATLTPSVKATLSGGYVGDVFHIGGAKQIAPAVVVDGVEKTPAVYGANPPWIAGMEVRVKLAGKKSAAGPVRVSVQSVEAVTEEF